MAKRRKKYFRMDDFEMADKSFGIYGPGITLYVDFDDVDHFRVEAEAEAVLEILNKHWTPEIGAECRRKARAAEKQWEKEMDAKYAPLSSRPIDALPSLLD